ncbi:MAG: hypothetical protein Q9163_000802, partial [Psora crenata]
TRPERTLSVTQGLEDFHFGDTAVGHPYLSGSSAYISPSQSRRRPLHPRPDQPSAHPHPHPHPSYDQSTSTTYPTFPPYPNFDPTFESTEDYSVVSDPASFVPHTPLRDSMSSILPSSTYEGFRDAERVVGWQRRRSIARSRRENKVKARRTATLLPSIQDPESSQAPGLSDSIDFFTAQSTSPAYTETRSAYPSAPSIPGSYGLPVTRGHPLQVPYGQPIPEKGGAGADPRPLEEPKKAQCWDHGCNGRTFSTFSNLLRHQREKSGTSSKAVCERCGAAFTRKTARDGHFFNDKCKGEWETDGFDLSRRTYAGEWSTNMRDGIAADWKGYCTDTEHKIIDNKFAPQALYYKDSSTQDDAQVPPPVGLERYSSAPFLPTHRARKHRDHDSSPVIALSNSPLTHKHPIVTEENFGGKEHTMASIFTYETEPVKVTSPWPLAPLPVEDTGSAYGLRQGPRSLAGIAVPPAASLADCATSKLDAEPQEGPIEYKLHLMLRPRRNFTAISTGQKISGSCLSKSRSPSYVTDPRDRSSPSSPAFAPSNRSRQNRLQHLTTQLLWRLQQSSSHHTSSRSSLVLPVLPESDLALSTARAPGPLIAGLEESLGALYEIGVSDDGTFVGLALDELEESLHVLRAMAFSLGCTIKVLRAVVVGDCQWEEEPLLKVKGTIRLRKEKLWVAEVLVAPRLSRQDVERGQSLDASTARNGSHENTGLGIGGSRGEIEQLRVSLTGTTTSGKSSLLGTLSTSTLDNGRGRSRLSLLKHRHEIVSGVTSSLAQELIGYREILRAGDTEGSTNIVNYASANVSSWTDMHNLAAPGRLVFVTDSAGHPKFRRTTVRGLVSWAPTWTLYCVAADAVEDGSGRVAATASPPDTLGSAGRGIELSQAHLELCLKLDLPLVVAITKLDLATRDGLRQTVAKVLSTLKAAGRKPSILPNHAEVKLDAIPEAIVQHEIDAVRRALAALPVAEQHLLVPIVLTSAVTGRGIAQIHALLRQLSPTLVGKDAVPKVGLSTLPRLAPSTLFHVDEVFQLSESHKSIAHHSVKARPCFILSGYLRYGSLEAGDQLFLGPFASNIASTVGKPQTHRASSPPGQSNSLPNDMAMYAQSQRDMSTGFASAGRKADSQANTAKTWQLVQVTSLRYLRLPVRKLLEGQVGTIAISTSDSMYLNADPCVRRGMILAIRPATNDPPPAYARVTAVFADPDIYVNPGSSVTVYTASIRAPAKIVEVSIPEAATAAAADDVFLLDGGKHGTAIVDDEQGAPLAGSCDLANPLEEIGITFQFTKSREWVEMGTKLLVTPASGISMLSPPRSEGGDAVALAAAAPAGLDGFVGRIVGASA